MATGVSVSDDVVTSFNNFKLRREPHNYKYIIYKIENNSTIVIEKTGAPNASYDDFITSLPNDECRYGLIDFDYTSGDGRPTDKLVLVSWCPDTARVKSKMVYSGSKEALKSVLVGVMVHINATDASEVSHHAVMDVVTRV
jgi:cofilin